MEDAPVLETQYEETGDEESASIFNQREDFYLRHVFKQ